MSNPALPDRIVPPPNTVRYNDWRQLDVAPLATFSPVLPVSVIIPYYQTAAETLARTLAALERQTYPRRLFEVIVVDDGSEPPLSQLPATSFTAKIVRQQRCGFGLARARNAGVSAACHDILLFLDSDILVESDWMATHARWHHAVSDAVTMGAYADVTVDDIDAAAIRQWRGSLREMLKNRPLEQRANEGQLIRTNDLTSPTDDPFSVMLGGNFGFSRDFYWSVGGHDESFVRWGMEEIELGCRAYVGGGLMVPVRDAFAWHQGRLDAVGRRANDRNLRLQRAKVAHLIPCHSIRGNSPGRIFTVPQHVVTVSAESGSTDQLLQAVANVLADRIHDLVVRVELSDANEQGRTWLDEVFGPDPRVYVVSTSSALDDFPVSPFHVTLPASVVARNIVFRLRRKMGDAVVATATLDDGTGVSIARAWALNRARRTGQSLDSFGDAKALSGAALKLRRTETAKNQPRFHATEPVGYPTKWQRLLNRAQAIRDWRTGWSFLKWLAMLSRKEVKARAQVRRRIPPDRESSSETATAKSSTE